MEISDFTDLSKKANVDQILKEISVKVPELISAQKEQTASIEKASEKTEYARVSTTAVQVSPDSVSADSPSSTTVSAPVAPTPAQPQQLDDIYEKLKAEQVREQSIRNDDREQDKQLKKASLIALFVLLSLETFIIFNFALFQATNFLGFRLEEWSFRLLISATIAQITIMLLVAIKYLFPSK